MTCRNTDGHIRNLEAQIRETIGGVGYAEQALGHGVILKSQNADTSAINDLGEIMNGGTVLAVVEGCGFIVAVGDRVQIAVAVVGVLDELPGGIGDSINPAAGMTDLNPAATRARESILSNLNRASVERNHLGQM